MIAYRVKPKGAKDRVLVVVFADDSDQPEHRARAVSIWGDLFRGHSGRKRLPALSCSVCYHMQNPHVVASYWPVELCDHVFVMGDRVLRVGLHGRALASARGEL